GVGGGAVGGAAGGGGGAGENLPPAVVAIAGIDVQMTAALALSESIPVRRRLGRGGQGDRCTDDKARECDFGSTPHCGLFAVLGHGLLLTAPAFKPCPLSRGQWGARWTGSARRAPGLAEGTLRSNQAGYEAQIGVTVIT